MSKKKLQHPHGYEVWLKVTIPPCSGSKMHCNSDEWWAMLNRALVGEPAYRAEEVSALYVEPEKLVLDRVKWAGVYCRKCEKATVEIVTEPPEFAPRPRGQLVLLG